MMTHDQCDTATGSRLESTTDFDPPNPKEWFQLLNALGFSPGLFLCQLGSSLLDNLVDTIIPKLDLSV